MCIIIAEAGENHLGDMEMARKLIDIAKDAGADYVKFQYYDASDCSDGDPEKEWFKKVQLDMVKIKQLYDYSRKRKIKFLCTPWDIEKARDLFSLGLRDFKVASFHITDQEMLKFMNEKADKVFMSTGMSNIEEVDTAVKIMDGVDLYIMHCVSEYPLAEENVNMKAMDYLKKRYKCKVGYSDHTQEIIAPLVAVSRGADVIEKHITLSKSYPGTDHILSAEPSELKTMVKYIRKVEKILGKEVKKITETELKNQEFLRKRFSYKKSNIKYPRLG